MTQREALDFLISCGYEATQDGGRGWYVTQRTFKSILYTNNIIHYAESLRSGKLHDEGFGYLKSIHIIKNSR